MVKKLLCRLIEQIGMNAGPYDMWTYPDGTKHLVWISWDGSVRDVRQGAEFLRDAAVRRHLDAVEKIREKYRGNPLVCGLD